MPPRHSTHRPKPPTPASEQAACDQWNKAHPVGTAVHVTLDDGTSKSSTTKSATK